jgi:hypothetical protein
MSSVRNERRVPRLGHDRFLSNSFQFIIYQYSFYLTLISSITDSGLKYPISQINDIERVLVTSPTGYLSIFISTYYYHECNEDYCLLGRDAVKAGRKLPAFQRNMLPPLHDNTSILKMKVARLSET